LEEVALSSRWCCLELKARVQKEGKKESTDIDKKTDKILAGAGGRFWEREEKMNREGKGA
jgi:hypothetical protein